MIGQESVGNVVPKVRAVLVHQQGPHFECQRCAESGHRLRHRKESAQPFLGFHSGFRVHDQGVGPVDLQLQSNELLQLGDQQPDGRREVAVQAVSDTSSPEIGMRSWHRRGVEADLLHDIP